MSLFASVSLIFLLLTLEYAFAFIMFNGDKGRYLNLRMICKSLENKKSMSLIVPVSWYTALWVSNSEVQEIKKQKITAFSVEKK